MARPLRYIASNITYHVFTRCRNLENYFKDDYYKAVCEEVLAYVAKVYKFHLNYYVFMDNHLHLAITTENDEHTISKIMQLIKSMIAKRMNKLLGICGPFWNERFGSTLAYFFPALCSYLAYNPVRKGSCNDPSDYKFGSPDVYRKKDGKSRLKITLHKHFLALGDTLEECFRIQLEIDEYYKHQ